MKLIVKERIISYTVEGAENTAEKLTTPEIVHNVMRRRFNPVQEEMHVLIMDLKNKLIDILMIAKGGQNMLVIKPKDIFRPLFGTTSNRFIIAHNHPTGDVQPSKEDIQFTERIIQAGKILGIILLDHIVYNRKDWYSFKENDRISQI